MGASGSLASADVTREDSSVAAIEDSVSGSSDVAEASASSTFIFGSSIPSEAASDAASELATMDASGSLARFFPYSSRVSPRAITLAAMATTTISPSKMANSFKTLFFIQIPSK